MATKKRTAKKASSKRASKRELRSFKVARSNRPFMSFQVTDQTVYWAVIGVLVIALGVWVTYLQVKINEIYDQVDANSYEIDMLPTTVKHHNKKAN